MDSIEEIISKSKMITDRLRLAVTIQNSMTQDGFDTNGLEFSNDLKVLEKRLVGSEKKLQIAQEEVSEAKQKVTKLMEELEKMTENNSSLTQTENALSSLEERAKDERFKKAQLLQSKLKTYKTLTGVRFDFNNDSDNILTGYIAISSNKPAQCILVPFKINKIGTNCTKQLWEEIKKANLEFIECS